MGFWSSKKVFSTREELKESLAKISTLTYEERQTVFEALLKEFDDGGVTSEELKRVVRELRAKQEISEIDKNKLLQLIK